MFSFLINLLNKPKPVAPEILITPPIQSRIPLDLFLDSPPININPPGPRERFKIGSLIKNGNHQHYLYLGSNIGIVLSPTANDKTFRLNYITKVTDTILDSCVKNPVREITILNNTAKPSTGLSLYSYLHFLYNKFYYSDIFIGFYLSNKYYYHNISSNYHSPVALDKEQFDLYNNRYEFCPSKFSMKVKIPA
jgi:hypothetical protein